MKLVFTLFYTIFLIFIFTDSVAQDVIGKLDFDERERYYEVYLPQNFQPNMPVIFFLHSLGDNVEKMKNYTLLHEFGSSSGFITVYPEAFQIQWNTGNLPEARKDDVGFISALIDTLKTEYDIDLKRVYCCGFGQGEAMSYKLAGELSHRITAIASVGGLMCRAMLPTNKPIRAVPILHIHGTADQWEPWEGTAAPLYLLSVEETINLWIQNNSCSPFFFSVSLPDIDNDDGCTVEKISYKDSSNETNIIFYKINGGGHNWPGASVNYSWEGKRTGDINANTEIWDLFKNYNNNPYVNIGFGQSKEISHNNRYFSTETDTFILNAQISNTENHQIEVYALMHGLIHDSQDSIQLFDDGFHGDIKASDNIFGTVKLLTGIGEDIFEVSLRTTDKDAGKTTFLNNPSRFTTIGPIEATSVYDTIKFGRQYIKLELQNKGSVTTATDLKVKINTTDPRVKEKEFAIKDFPDLAAGISDTSSFSYYFYYADGYVPDSTKDNPIHFDYTITSDGIPYWEGSFAFTLTPVVGVEDEQLNTIPQEFALEQNYPNPFNPSTTIKYSIPSRPVMLNLVQHLNNEIPAQGRNDNTVETHEHVFVQLKIYDILGREVATLVDTKQKPRNYEVEWNAINQPSGVYLYQINIGEFRATKKMILLH